MLPNLNKFSWRAFSHFATAGLVAAALSACGGGGGSPGTVPGAPGTTPGAATAANVTLVTSASTIAASGADGTEVILTAIVKDANNNAIPGAKVDFSASSGNVTNTNRIADATGTVTEKLNVKGDSSARVISITATSGSATSPAKTVTVTTSTSTTPKLLLTSSSGTLASSGATGTAVQIKALVLDSNNVVMPNTRVTFATDSGALSASQVNTDVNGVASVNLATGTDPTTRVITVSGNVAGAPVVVVKVNVAGTRITVNASNTVNLGASSDVTVALFDSADAPLANTPVSFSAAINSLVAKNGSNITDSAGKLVLSYTASRTGSDVVTVRALGESANASIAISTAAFSITAVDINGVVLASANTNECYAVNVSNFVSGVAQGGTVTVSTSRGAVFSDVDCTLPLSSATTLTAGAARVYVKATGPGIATLSASSTATNSTVQSTLEFVAPLISTSVISLQGTPAVVGANLPGSTTEQVTLRAVVMDKISQGNPVKNARVSFSIVTDASGGSLSQPSTLLTGSDGSATISYIAGTTTTAADGVLIRAVIQSPVTSQFAETKLTVGKKSLFISAGTGNAIVLPNSTTYQVDYVVFVTDAAGNAVRDVAVTGSVRPRNYMKGIWVLQGPNGPWAQTVTKACVNEDENSDGVLGFRKDGKPEDQNGNGRLDPVIPMTISSTGKTDASGTAIISMIYPRDRAFWLDVDFTIRGAVAGSEASYVGYTVLPGLALDYGTAASPPGVVSPYGKSSICEDTN
ncbi:beta strand repeat-containing protein [Massilia sp. TWR1-2-2]|uniref:beta strand repeat-containing protein n=1 Tax=Massilia sp. TWR1-2-2 TaxID=2804584 RepID=UPI003CEA3ADF